MFFVGIPPPVIVLVLEDFPSDVKQITNLTLSRFDMSGSKPIDASPDDVEEKVELPNWMFDIDDEDESANSSKTLFQELEIDPGHIYRYEWNDLFVCQ